MLKLGVAQFLHGCVVLTPVELGVGLHHRFLLVLWHVSQARIVCYNRIVLARGDAHLLRARLGEGGVTACLLHLVLLLSDAVGVIAVL